MLVGWLESRLIDPIDRLIDRLLPNGNANALLRIAVFVPLLLIVFLPLQLVEMLFESMRSTLSVTASPSVELDRRPCPFEVSE